MASDATRVPVHAVTGEAGRAAWIAARVAADPGSLGLVHSHEMRTAGLVSLPGGCPCCTARVALQVSLARLLRERRPSRIYVEIADAGHAARLGEVLRGWPLGQYVEDAGEIRAG